MYESYKEGLYTDLYLYSSFIIASKCTYVVPLILFIVTAYMHASHHDD